MRIRVKPARPSAAGGTLYLVATPIGGGHSISTGLITLGGGQSVDWTLERSLRNSSFSVH